MSESLKIKKVIPAQETRDGGGVRIKRSIGSFGISHVDPFLLLDEFSSENPDDYVAGFPPHPHRGFETVTYMITGKMQHEDSAGHKGILESGGVQWMTAGRGVVHSEMPLQDKGLMKGFQLWINLPASRKMDEPHYQNIEKSQIPEVSLPGLNVKVIAGKFENAEGPVKGVYTNPTYLDVEISNSGIFNYEVFPDNSSFAYIFEGSVDFGSGPIGKGNLCLFADSGILEAKTDSRGRFIFLQARQIKESIARSGPFVMNTKDEIVQAYRDFGI